MDAFSRRLLPAFAPETIRRENVTNPAAGADFVLTVPGGRIWRLLSLRAQLLTDANAANRNVTLRVDDGNGDFAHYPFNTTHAASIDRRYCWVWGPTSAFEASGSSGNLVQPGPQFLLLPGWRLEVVTGNVQAGDQWSAITAMVEEGSADVSIPDQIGRVLQHEYVEG